MLTLHSSIDTTFIKDNKAYDNLYVFKYKLRMRDIKMENNERLFTNFPDHYGYLYMRDNHTNFTYFFVEEHKIVDKIISTNKLEYELWKERIQLKNWLKD
jgi:hypothetical protein